jgi:oxygen-independent coproporphyrinogen-3 oxidase
LHAVYYYHVKLQSLAGIYIHIPFCKKACNYCNFHFSTQLELKEAFIESLRKEISLQKDFISADEAIETIYFGGGTPSILNTIELEKIIDDIRVKFRVSEDAEITLEANPDDITIEKVKSWKAIGINRLSLGVQSFFDDELKWMNRAHDAENALKSIDDIIEAGISNFSVDLIFGSPVLTNENLKINLDVIAQKNIPHLSCYALTVEPKTQLSHLIEKKKIANINTDKQAEQFLIIADYLGSHGYEQYEISNYAKPGMRSKHNSSYWQGKSYYGLGPSAHSFDGRNKRRWNIANNALFIKSLSLNKLNFEEEVLTPTQQINEYIMTALRTIEGIDLNKIDSNFGKDYSNELLLKIENYQKAEKVINTEARLVLTREGKLFADGIAADLFF